MNGELKSIREISVHFLAYDMDLPLCLNDYLAISCQPERVTCPDCRVLLDAILGQPGPSGWDGPHI